MTEHNSTYTTHGTFAIFIIMVVGGESRSVIFVLSLLFLSYLNIWFIL